MKRRIAIASICLIAVLLFCLSSCSKAEFELNFIVDDETYATVATGGNETIKMPDDPTKEGYTFDGWYWDDGEWKKPFTANSLLDAPLSSDMSVYAKFVSDQAPLTQDSIIDALKKVPNVVAVAVATEYNDPNGQLNKAGGYIADIFFSVDVVNQKLITGNTLVEKGTDAGGSIEIYPTQKDAEKRNEYLSTFDGGVLSSGSHKVVGTCVIRTSDTMTASLQNILEGNLEKMLTGSTEEYVNMDTYLIEVAKQVATEENLSEYETATKLIEYGYPLEKSETIAKNCGVNWNGIAKNLAEAYDDYYATIFPQMIADLLADHEFTETNIKYALENASINWRYYVKIHAKDFVNSNENDYYISPLDVISYLNNEKGYSVEDSEHGAFNCDVNWNAKAVEYIECIDADGILGPKSDYINALMDVAFTQAQAQYAVNNCGKDWNSHALLCMKHFVEDLCTTKPEQAECIAKLKAWGFSDSEATYAVNNYEFKYKITLNPDGGSLSNNFLNVVFGQPFTLPTPTKDGYTFEGWYDGTTKFEDGVWNIPNGITLTAKWESYTISTTSNQRIEVRPGVYINNAGTYTSYTNKRITAGTMVTLTATVNTGYIWLGWYDGETLVSSEMTYTFAMPRKSITYTAKSEVDPALSNFIFSSTKITGIKDKTVTSITIPDYITSIGDEAFIDCTELKTVYMGKGVTKIGNSAFYNCTKLTAVYITDIDKWAALDFYTYDSNPLYYAGNLYLNGALVRNVVISDGVKVINDYAFENCQTLTSISLPNSVTRIGDDAFSGCISLTSITLGAKLDAIGDNACDWCTNLRYVRFRGTSAQWASVTKGTNWDQYYTSTGYKKINYTLVYNYTG